MLPRHVRPWPCGAVVDAQPGDRRRRDGRGAGDGQRQAGTCAAQARDKLMGPGTCPGVCGGWRGGAAAALEDISVTTRRNDTNWHASP